MGVRVIKETDSQKILSLLQGAAYRDHYKRDGEVAEVGIEHLLEVYEDFRAYNRDNGEWNASDILQCLNNFGETKVSFITWLFIKVTPSDEDVFWKAIRRLFVLDYINQEHCDGIGFTIMSRELVELADDEFEKKALALVFIDGDKDEKKEFQEELKSDQKIFELLGYEMFYCAFYSKAGLVKIIVPAKTSQEAIVWVFKKYPDQKETEGEDILGILSSDEFDSSSLGGAKKEEFEFIGH